MNNKFFASVQFSLGIIAMAVVVISYVKFGSLLKASISDSSGGNSEVLRKVIDDSIAASEKSVNISSSSWKCASESTLQAFAEMRSELPKINAIISSSMQMISSVEKNLPIKMSSATENTKTIKFTVPYIEEGTQKIELPFFKIDEKEEKITQIEVAPIPDKKYFLTVCEPKGSLKKCEGSLLEYIKKIDIKPSTYSWKNPVITQSIHQVSVHIPKISLKEQSFDIQEVKISSQPIMGDVKEQLQLLSQQLTAISTLPIVADNWIQLLQREFEQCPAQLHEEETRKIIAAFRQNLIDARDKITVGQGASGEIFKAAAGFVPCLFLILGLLSAGMAASGGAKLFVKGKKKQDGKGGGQTQECGNNVEQVQQEAIHSNPQQSICEQSVPVEQQQS